MPDEAPTDLSVLMALDPLELTAQDLDAIIAYQRKQRAMRASGVKTKKTKADSPQVNIKDLLGRIAAPAPSGVTIKRRV